MAAPILWTPEKMRSFCRKTHVHKIPRFRGGIWGGGGSADFIFMGARIFLTLVNPLTFTTYPVCTLWKRGDANHLCSAGVCRAHRQHLLLATYDLCQILLLSLHRTDKCQEKGTVRHAPTHRHHGLQRSVQVQGVAENEHKLFLHEVLNTFTMKVQIAL